MSTPRIGSLCTGYGGLETAVLQVLGGTVAWHADNDPGAAAILAHHWPEVPNLGDLTAVDFAQVEPVHVLTAGFPCQDVSLAGKRAGIADGTRSGLWRHVARAIHELQPRMVVIENVRGLLSTQAHSDLEPCTWCLGDGGGEPPLRALGAVLGDLAGLGFDAEWASVRASDVGAPHQRERVFLLAWPADAEGAGLSWPRLRRRAAERGGAPADTDRVRVHGDGPDGREPQRHAAGPGGPAADTARFGRQQGRSEPARQQRGPDAPLSGDPVATNSDSSSSQARRGRSGTGDARRSQPVVGGVTNWGPYAAAVARWEHVTGRRAPAPTEPTGRDGASRLSPRFVEWLMGLPAGHVTAVPGLTRTAQLKALGNGVVPQQAAAALRLLIARADRRAAA